MRATPAQALSRPRSPEPGRQARRHHVLPRRLVPLLQHHPAHLPGAARAPAGRAQHRRTRHLPVLDHPRSPSVDYIRRRNLSSDEGDPQPRWSAPHPEHASTPWESAARNDAQRYSPCISGTIREHRVNVCQVAPVLHQMKWALERARCSYPLFISGPARPRDKQWVQCHPPRRPFTGQGGGASGTGRGPPRG